MTSSNISPSPAELVMLELMANMLAKPVGWVYRGRSDSERKLVPSIGHTNDDGTRKYNLALEESIFEQFHVNLRQSHYFYTPLQMMGLAQHYGLPTRLLDWTQNPMIALYFAVCEADDKDGEILMVEVPYDDVRRDIISPFDRQVTGTRPIFVAMPEFDVRMERQSGVFSLHPDPTQPWNLAPFESQRLEIRASAKPHLRDILAAQHLTEDRLLSNTAEHCSKLKKKLTN